MFKTRRIKVGYPPSMFRAICRYWDKAGTKGGGTYTVGTKIGMDLDGKFWVLDVVRVQLDSFERERLIEQIADIDGMECIIGIEQEPGSGGKESAEHSATSLAGYRVRIIKVDAQTGGKIQRADPWSVQMNAGNVYLPADQRMADGSDGWDGWGKEWVEEHRFFPFSKYKDQVDSASGAFSLCHKRKVRVGAIDPSTAYVGNTVLEQVKALRRGRYKEKKVRAFLTDRA
jgi:predicted phage terminase large subunit-like protein